MFNKAKCSNCNEKLNKKFSFCPSCGKRLGKNSPDYGMLGRNDSVAQQESPFGGKIFGNLNEKMLNKMLGGAMKMLEKEMKKSISMEKQPKTKLRLMINGKEVKMNQNPSQPQKQVEKDERKILPRKILNV